MPPKAAKKAYRVDNNQNVGIHAGEKTHRENTSPYAPGGIGTDARACSDGSSGHD